MSCESKGWYVKCSVHLNVIFMSGIIDLKDISSRITNTMKLPLINISIGYQMLWGYP